MARTDRTLAVHFGWVSLFQDLGSKMVIPFVPLFITVGLGASPLVVGVVDGVATATVALVAPFVGRATTPARAAGLVRLGYGASSVAKLALAAVSAWGWVLVVRVIDRAGKGVRDAPRDLLLAAGPPGRRATAFGVQQAMDKLGGAIGPLVGLAVYRVFDDSFDAVFLAAFLPCALSVALLFRRFPAPPAPLAGAGAAPVTATLSTAQRRRIAVLGIGAVGTVPVALLIVRAMEQGAGVSAVLGAYAVLRLVTAAMAIPAGRLADRVGAAPVLVAAHLGLAAAFVLAAAGGRIAMWFVLVVVGASDALSRGPAKAWLVDAGGALTRGAVLGAWGGASAAAGLVAGVAVGALWGDDGTVPLLLGAAVVGAAAVGVAAEARRGAHPPG